MEPEIKETKNLISRVGNRTLAPSFELIGAIFLFVVDLVFVGRGFVRNEGKENGAMSISKPPNSTTAVDKALGVASTEPNANVKGNGGDQAQADNAAQAVTPRAELSADGATKYLQRTSAISCREIDALISDLSRLRERLAADGGRLEQGVIEFATLGQSVIRLTEVVSDSVAHVKAPGVAE